MSTSEKRTIPEINRLINIAKENRDSLFNKEICEDLTEAAKFCLNLNIKEGGNKIFEDIVYDAYVAQASTPQSKIEFIKDFSYLYERRDGKEKPFYKLNYKPAQLLNVANKKRVRND